MDKNEILEVLSAFSASSATLLHYEKAGSVFTLDKSVQRGDTVIASGYGSAPVYAPQPSFPNPAPAQSVSSVQTSTPTESPAPTPVSSAQVTAPVPAEITTSVATGLGTPVKSQLVGVYYGAPTPDSAPFVKIGQEVKEGDTLCIIEAMKVMNEIKAPKAGKVVSILVESGDLVEFGQVIIEIA